MKTRVWLVAAVCLVALAGPIGEARSAGPSAAPAGTPPPTGAPAKCEHGVAKALCARCNPKLAPVFQAKGDWCKEHARPESQCVICHPELAREGVK